MAELMTLREVARYLRLSDQTLYKMVEQGRVPALKAGTRWRFRKDEIDNWMRRKAKGVRRARVIHRTAATRLGARGVAEAETVEGRRRQ
jgi:excisionase family DNA binding protein